MGLMVKPANPTASGLQRLWQTFKTRFWDFMDRIARAQRTTPACHG